jgi:hypothetical protein
VTDIDFTRFLVDRGLAAAGSDDTIQDLKQRYGMRRWFNFSDVIDLPRASLFPEQTEAFFVPADKTCLVPSSRFECDFDYHRNGPRTHAVALERFTSLFGAPEPGISVNTLCATWTFERMSLRILTFLREKTTPGSPLYAKNPELWEFCRISIDRNWVRPLAESEGSMLDSFGPSDVLPLDRAFLPSPRLPYPWDRGLLRLARTSKRDAAPFLWKHDGNIGWRAEPWAAFFERSQCSSLELSRVEPGRSPGYSQLELKLRNPFSLEHEPVSTVVLRGKSEDTLDQVAADVSEFWGLPLNVEDSWAD